MISKRFSLFLLVSGVAAVANVGSRTVFSLWLPYVPSIMLAFCIGLSCAFVLNRLFVFRDAQNPAHRQAFWFTIVNLAAVSQTIVVSLVLVDIVFPHIRFHWHAEMVAHALGVAVPVVSSFLGHKHLTFR